MDTPLEEFAAQMRENPTPQEETLARYLTFFNHRWQFTPQSIMGSYILDFYCDELKLAIEVDGAHHKTQAYEDGLRTVALNMHGIRVVRIQNDTVDHDPDLALAEIALEAVLRERDLALGMAEKNVGFEQYELGQRYCRRDDTQPAVPAPRGRAEKTIYGRNRNP